MKLISFNKLWEECTQEESWLITREENMGSTEDESLTVHSRRNHKRRTVITKVKINLEEILPVLYATLVMRRDITPNIVPKTKAPSTRSQIRRAIMLTPLKMMNQ